MQRHHTAPATTHTVEMAQLAELSQQLADRSRPALTARQLELAGETAHDGHDPVTLPPDVPLVRVSWSGSPEFPDIYGHFDVPRHESAAVSLLLHSASLRRLSRHFGLRHVWGVGDLSG